MKYQIQLKKQRIILIFLLFTILLGFFALSFVLLQPAILLKHSEVTIGYKEAFTPEVPKVKLLWKDLKKNVKITNPVDTNCLGTYEVLYQVKEWNHWFTKKQVVHVKDTKAPVITLTGVNPISACPKGEVKDEGATAEDDFDGDLTAKIKTTVYETKIVYEVTDQSGNRATLARDIIREDTTPPELVLNGEEVITLYLGTTFTDPGASARDGCDMEVEVKTTGAVDPSKIGTYTITYEATDSSGNLASKTRTVRVIAKPNNQGKVIYLTFDDGPSSTITPGILQILKEENVKATFFVINHSDTLNYLIKQAYDEGHTIAIHSYTHNYGQIYASEQAYFNDLNLMREKIHTITGHYSNFIRFPGGSSNTVSRFNPGIMSRLVKQVEAKGYVYFDWNVGSGDAGGSKNSTDVYRSVINGLGSKTNIVLMHDFEGNYKTLNALRDIIRYGKQNGYTFAPITESTPAIHHGVNN